MASVPNRVYPLREYNEIITNVVRATNSYATNSYPTVINQQSVTSNSGSRIISGFIAGAAIGKYQPVTFFTETGSLIYLSGATGRAPTGVIGVSLDNYAVGATASVITQGLVPFQNSGSAAITRGASVISTPSGSVYTGSLGFYFVESLLNADVLSVTGSGILGIAIITGSGRNSVTQVWIAPQSTGVS